MAQPGTPGSQVPAGEDWIARKFRDLDREIGELRAENILLTAGIEAYPDLVRIVGGLDVEGAMRLTGTLSLPAGIIDNDALTSPVKVASDIISTSNFAYTTTATDRASISVPVPDGFTSVSIFAGGSARAYNVSGSTQYLFAQVFADVVGGGTGDQTTWGGTQQVAIPTGYQATLAGTLATTITVPAAAGQRVTIWTQSWASTAIGAHSGNYTGVEAVLIFTR